MKILDISLQYFPINIGRIILCALVLFLIPPGNNTFIFNILSFLVLCAVLYLIVETLFNLSNRTKFAPYFATTLDIMFSLIYCYLTGLNSVCYGVFLYITAVCALNIKTKQAEYSVILPIILQILLNIAVYYNWITFVDILNRNSSYSLVSGISTIILANAVNIFNYFLVRNLVRSNYNLLCNIMPQKIVDRLQTSKNRIADYYENATVVFTDFVAFTDTTKNMTPNEIVEGLEEYFSEFDNIIKKYNLEKLKTIGDGYMFASGIPDVESKNYNKAISASFEILNLVISTRSNKKIKFSIRIGIANGPVMAAVIGKTKYAYDIWGSTVNLASRLETNSEPDCICLLEESLFNIDKRYTIYKKEEKYIKGFGKKKLVLLKLENHLSTVST